MKKDVSKEVSQLHHEEHVYMTDETSFPIRICFLFHSKAFWPSWESFWYACQKDPRVEATMLFCPVQELPSGHDGQFVDAESFLREKEIPYIHINKYNFCHHTPDYLIIQTPYDNWHRNKKWRSEEFKTKGMKVVYISYGLEFVENEDAIEKHFRLPIYQNANKIFTFADFMQEDYKKFGNINTNVVKSVGHPKFDALFNANKNKLPKDLRERIGNKKCIVWHPHFPCKYSLDDGKLVQSTFSWEKNLQLLNYMCHEHEVFFIFMAHHMFWGIFEKEFSIPSEDISSFRNTIISSNNMVLWEGDYPNILACADAIIGERSAVTMETLLLQKPVCYLEQHPEIYNRFGQDALKSFYYASQVDQVFKFIEDIKNNIDPKVYKREQIFNDYFKKHFDGKCGERIIEELIRDFPSRRMNYLENIYDYIYYKHECTNKLILQLNDNIEKYTNKPIWFTFNEIHKKNDMIHRDLSYVSNTIDNIISKINSTTSLIRIFNIIPIMKIVKKNNKKIYYLFNFIPIITIKIK